MATENVKIILEALPYLGLFYFIFLDVLYVDIRLMATVICIKLHCC